MKTILIATDFSDAARSASRYGLELAGAFHARVILFNAWQQMPVPATDTPVVLTSAEMEVAIQQDLAAELKLLHCGDVIPVETACAEGPAAGQVLKAAEQYKASLIVAGMKQGGKGLRKLFGSVVTTLARRSGIPLLVVPETAAYQPIATIAVANAGDVAPETDSHLLDTLRELAERFHSKLYLVRVAANPVQAAYEERNQPFQLHRRLQSLAPQFECIEDKDISKGLSHFVKAHEVNLLAILPHHRSRLNRWVYRSITREMVLETPIPLLVLPEHAARQ